MERNASSDRYLAPLVLFSQPTWRELPLNLIWNADTIPVSLDVLLPCCLPQLSLSFSMLFLNDGYSSGGGQAIQISHLGLNSLVFLLHFDKLWAYLLVTVILHTEASKSWHFYSCIMSGRTFATIHQYRLYPLLMFNVPECSVSQYDGHCGFSHLCSAKS